MMIMGAVVVTNTLTGVNSYGEQAFRVKNDRKSRLSASICCRMNCIMTIMIMMIVGVVVVTNILTGVNSYGTQWVNCIRSYKCCERLICPAC